MVKSETLRNILKKATVPAKIVGVVLLLAHVLTADVTYNPIWIVVYLAITAGVALVAMGCLAIYQKLTDKHHTGVVDDQEAMAERSLSQLQDEVKRNPWQLLLIPGEDGLFFLPLLYIGINPMSVLVATLLFGLAHINAKPLFACLATTGISFVLCMVVLPHGILPMSVGHILVDLTIFALLPYMGKSTSEDDWGVEDGYPEGFPYDYDYEQDEWDEEYPDVEEQLWEEDADYWNDGPLVETPEAEDAADGNESFLEARDEPVAADDAPMQQIRLSGPPSDPARHE